MSNSITYSSELMTNYLSASIMDPDDAFEALQDSLGNSLLFSIGADGIFYVTRETPMNNSAASSGTANGWERIDLSSAVLGQDYPGLSLPCCKTMSVNQNIADGTIGLAMVITVAGNDMLYLCMGNSASDTSWLSSPFWTQCPYNFSQVQGQAPTPPSPFTIVNVFISESENAQYIITDIVNGADVQRYYIVSLVPLPQWNLHALAIDLSPGLPYQSCIGRNYGSGIDGMYTFGQVDNATQFMYCPLWNSYGAAPPSPTLLNLPMVSNPAVSLQPQSMASFRNGNPNGSTDLFVTATDANDNGCLYYFTAEIRRSMVNGTPVLSNSLFIDVEKLYADLTNGIVTVWGMNNADVIFYTSCPYDQLTESAWSVPVILLTGVDMVSPYINQVNNGNTIFAVGGNQLSVLTKSPVTGLWTTNQVMLPPPVGASAPVSFSSYTTRIQLFDQNNQPVGNTPLLVSAGSRTGYYVNNLYTVLDTNAIEIDTDLSGVITLIESVSGLQGTKITVSEPGGSPTIINPMDTPFNKVAALNTTSALQNAVTTNPDGSTTPLVAPGTSTTDLQTVATGNTNLNAAYTNMSSSGPAARHYGLVKPKLYVLAGYEDAILMDVGDIYSWLATGIESVITIVEDAASGIWNFIANIAGQVYQGILDCVEKVVAAAEWVFNAIKTAIEDLIKFLEFLFEWKDILATHNVIKNIFTQYVSYAISNLKADQAALASFFTTIENDIDQWANIPGFGQTPQGTTGSNAPNPASGSAPANLGVHHFQGNAGSATTAYTPPVPSTGIFTDLMNFLEAEENVAAETITAIENVISQFGTLTLAQIIQQLVAVMADALLDATQQLLEFLLEVLILAADGIIELMTAEIDIPILSWLYQEMSGNPLSFLDVLCLICAIPATIVCKIVEDTAPFPHGDALTESLINATSFEAIQTIFQAPSFGYATDGSPGTDPVIQGQALETFELVTGFCALVGTTALVFTSKFATPNSVLSFLAAVSNVFYVSPNIPSMTYVGLRWDQKMNGICTDVSILKAFVLDIPYAGSEQSKTCECLLNFIWNAPVIENIYQTTSGEDPDPTMVVDSVANFAFNIGGMLTPLTDNPVMFAAQYVFMQTYGMMAMGSGMMNDS